MKKKFLFGLIALLSVSFIFFGCGDSGGGGGGLGGDLSEEAEALATELNGLGFTGVTYDGTGAVTLGEGGAIPGGETLSVPDGLTLVLPADQTLTVPANGELEVAAGGALTIAETATLEGAIGATIVVNGTVTGGTNFYSATGTAGGNAVAGATYTWVADADEEGNPGWKALVDIVLSLPVWSADTPNKASVNEMMARLWSDASPSVVQNILQGGVFSYASATNTLTVNKTHITTALKEWIVTNWGGTSVPVKLVVENGALPAGGADPNWSGANLAWIDLADFTDGSVTVTLQTGTISYTIAGSGSYPVEVPTPSASITTGTTITGTTDAPLSGTITITVVNDEFEDITNNEDVTTSWFTGLPTGVSAKVTPAVTAGAKTVTIALTGTLTAVSSDVLDITIPGTVLDSEEELSVDNDDNIGFAITLSAARASLATLEAAGLTNIEVTDAETVTLTNDNATVTTVTIPGTITLALSTYSITLDTSAVLTIADPEKITGTGKIIATAGTITIGEDEDYTTTVTGVAGDELATAVPALTADAAKLVDSVDLKNTFYSGGSETNYYGIGSLTLTDNSATAVLDGADGSDGSNIELNVNTDFAAAVTTTDPNVIGTNADDIEDATFTLTLDSGTLKLTDSDATNTNDKVGIVTFSGVQLKNSELIAPVAVADFSIGVSTVRD